VSLDVLPADVPAEYAPAMVAACTDALTEGRCAMAATLPESTPPQAVALVLWQGDGFLQVTVRVGRGGGQWLSRALTFSERDSISERWTTVGLTVATLVGETRALEAQPIDGPAGPVTAAPADEKTPNDAAGATPPKSASKPRLVIRQKPALPLWLVSLGALVGPGWDRGGWQVGGWLSLGFRVPRTPLLLFGAGSYALSAGPTIDDHALSSRFATVALGAGLFGTLPALNLAGSAALELGYRHIDVSLNAGSASDQEAPLRLRTLVSFPAEGRVAATAGAVVRLPPQNSAGTDGSSLRGPAFSAEVIAGLEVRL
jgi:hypothetical protein